MKTSRTAILILTVVLAVAASAALPANRAAAASAASAGLAQQASSMGTVTASRLNVRSGPGVTNRKLDLLKQGDRVEIVGRQPGWLQIVYPAGTDGKAWVSAAYVAVDGEAAPQAAATATVSAPAAAKAGGKLVFQNRNGGDIFIMNADGSGLRKLTHGFEPALSPDGTQVAFTRFSDPQGLYLINVDGTNERQVYGANRPRSPTWTPDGQSIIFEWSPRSRDCYNTPFGCITAEQWYAITGGKDCLNDDSPCLGDFAKFDIYFTNLSRLDLASGAIRDLPAGETAISPQQNPQDDRVLYLDKDGLFTTRNEGSDPPQNIVKQPNLIGIGAWSPDGQYVYAMRRTHDHWDIWRWRADGSEPVALTSQPALSPRPINNVAPTVSPDGKQVAFLTDRNGKWELYVMNSDGSSQRPLAPQALSGVTFQFDNNSDRTVDWGK